LKEAKPGVKPWSYDFKVTDNVVHIEFKNYGRCLSNVGVSFRDPEEAKIAKIRLSNFEQRESCFPNLDTFRFIYRAQPQYRYHVMGAVLTWFLKIRDRQKNCEDLERNYIVDLGNDDVGVVETTDTAMTGFAVLHFEDSWVAKQAREFLYNAYREKGRLPCMGVLDKVNEVHCRQLATLKEMLGDNHYEKLAKEKQKISSNKGSNTMAKTSEYTVTNNSDDYTIDIDHYDDDGIHCGNWSLNIPNDKTRKKCFELITGLLREKDGSLDDVNLDELETKVSDADVNKEYDTIIDELIDQGALPADFRKKSAKTLTKKLKTTKEESTMDIKEIIKLKMMTKILNKKGEIDIKQLMMLQMLTNDEGFEITDVLKTKLMASLFDGKTDLDNMTTEQLMVYGMIQNGEFDINKLIEIKFMSKILDDDDDEDDEEKAEKK